MTKTLFIVRNLANGQNICTPCAPNGRIALERMGKPNDGIWKVGEKTFRMLSNGVCYEAEPVFTLTVYRPKRVYTDEEIWREYRRSVPENLRII